MHPVRVVCVDDQETFRHAARELVGATTDFEAVGEASCGADALATIGETHPELVLLDVRMPGMDGIETARRIRADHPEVVVVLVSAEDPDDLAPAAKDCGAAATIRKQDLGPRRLASLWSALRRDAAPT
jgi:DNA-binding NarL/FixJ family response regulator